MREFYYENMKYHVIDAGDNKNFILVNHTEDEIKEFKLKPFPHQVEAINFGLNPKHNGKWLLLDSMGLGKTCEII